MRPGKIRPPGYLWFNILGSGHTQKICNILLLSHQAVIFLNAEQHMTRFSPGCDEHWALLGRPFGLAGMLVEITAGHCFTRSHPPCSSNNIFFTTKSCRCQVKHRNVLSRPHISTMDVRPRWVRRPQLREPKEHKSALLPFSPRTPPPGPESRQLRKNATEDRLW